MSTANIPTLLRLVSASVCVAKRAGLIVKNVLNKGPSNLGKIDKVSDCDLIDTIDPQIKNEMMFTYVQY